MTRATCLVALLLSFAACGTADGRGESAPPPTTPTPPPAETPPPALPCELDGSCATYPADESSGAHVEAPPPPPAAPAIWPACVREAACAAGPGAWPEGTGGFMTRALLAGPLAARHVRARDVPAMIAGVAADGAAWRLTATADEAFTLGSAGGGRGEVFLLRARVHSDEAQEVALRLGASGRVTALHDGVIVAELETDQRLLADQWRVPLALRAGWNDLALRVEQVRRAPMAVALRLRALDGGPVSGLLWDLPEEVDPAAGVCEALAFDLALSAEAEGWRIRATVAAPGLVPPPEERTWSLGVDGRTAPLAAGPLDSAALARGETPALDALLADDALDGVSSTALSLTVGGVACLTRRLALAPGLRRRLVAARDTLPDLPAAVPFGARASLEHLVARLEAALAAEDEPHANLDAELMELETLVAVAAAGDDPWAERVGLVTRAYRSELDGSLQPYVLLVPESYTRRPDADFPLIVASHGLRYSAEDMIRIVSGHPTPPGGARAARHGLAFPPPAVDALIVAHHGYGDAGHRAPGELDVLRVIDEVSRAYRVDPRRVTLTGFSLGGSVAFWVPLRYPDRFAGAAPLCGYPNVPEYRTVRAARKRPWEHTLIAAEDIAQHAEGGRYLPLRVVHGARDRPERSEHVAARYRELGYAVEVDVPDLGHNVWDYAYEDGSLLAWLARQRRPEVAAAPRVRTARYRWGTNEWLRLDRFERHGEHADLAGQLGRARITVRTDNAVAFSILAHALGDRRDGAARLVVDGQDLGEHPLAHDLHLARADGRWAVVPELARPPGHKRPGVEGPLGDLWYGPFVVVYGASDPAQTDANRRTAEEVRRYNPWTEVAMPVVADVDVAPADLRGRGVVLVGSPRSNAVLASITAELPMRFDHAAIELGGIRYEGAEVGISTILPSPFDPDHYLVVHAGLGPEGTLSARHLPEWAPDYLIYDDGIRVTWWDYLLGRREVLAGGFYDAGWRLP